MKPKKQFLFVLALTFILAWVLGALRFNYELAEVLFKVLLFPFGLLYSIYEEYSIPHLASSHILNNEFFQLLAFGFSILCQTTLFYFILNKIMRSKIASVN